MAKLVSRVVNSLANDVAKLHDELQGGAFLEAEAKWILEDKGYGRRIWGEGCGANTRLKSNFGGTYPRWGAMTASGEHIENDQKMIKLTFRHWMAVRLQIKINAPSRETRRSAETNSKRQGGPGSYQEEGAPDVLPHHDSLPPHSLNGGIALATVEARLDAKDNEWGPGVASDSSEQKRPSIDVEPSVNQYSLKRKRSNVSGKTTSSGGYGLSSSGELHTTGRQTQSIRQTRGNRLSLPKHRQTVQLFPMSSQQPLHRRIVQSW